MDEPLETLIKKWEDNTLKLLLVKDLSMLRLKSFRYFPKQSQKFSDKRFFKFILILILSQTMSFLQAQSLEKFEAELSRIANKVSSSVVSIEVLCNQLQQRVSSGVILDKEGHIITVANALKRSKKIYVCLKSGRKYPAKIIGKDIETNLAILHIKAQNLIPVERGNSSKLRVGSFLIIIGNPYGLRNSVVIGHVSGLMRTVRMRETQRPLTGLIQTTAPINPGDVGGLVVDSKGKFVGIACSTLSHNPNNQQKILLRILKLLDKIYKHKKRGLESKKLQRIIQEMKMQNRGISDHFKMGFSRNFLTQGINFILPSDSIYWVAKQIIRKPHSKIERGWAGITVINDSNGFGVKIVQILPKSPASKANLKVGDLLLTFNGYFITDSLCLLHKMSLCLSGEVVCFKVKRGKRPAFDVKIHLSKR